MTAPVFTPEMTRDQIRAETLAYLGRKLVRTMYLASTAGWESARGMMVYVHPTSDPEDPWKTVLDAIWLDFLTWTTGSEGADQARERLTTVMDQWFKGGMA